MGAVLEGPCPLILHTRLLRGDTILSTLQEQNQATHRITAQEIKELLGLAPHPREGGWYVRTYESEDFVGQAALDLRYLRAGAGGPRRTGTAIYYLLEPDSFSEMHRLLSDEIFHFYLGDPVEMLQLLSDGSASITLLGTDLAKGQRPQHVIPQGVWQGSRLIPGGSFALLGCIVAPGFEFEDYETGDRVALCSQWPQHSGLISALTR